MSYCRTPLHISTENGLEDLSYNLVDLGVNLDLQDSDGRFEVGVESNWNSFEIRSIRFENLRFD